VRIEALAARLFALRALAVFIAACRSAEELRRLRGTRD
jgi:hypothetical protein